jgi:hypothetical protein
MRGGSVVVSRRKKNVSPHTERERAEAQRARRESAERARVQAAAREAKIRAALTRPVSTTDRLVSRTLEAETRAEVRNSLALLLRVVAERAPRLLVPDMIPALRRMAERAWVQGPSNWEPLGKGRDTLFRSLAEHLFARYRVPPVLWTAFFDEESAEVLTRVAVRVANGYSLYEDVASGLLPVPLTRKMCHEVLTQPGEATFLAVIRRVQIRATGGHPSFARTWMATRAGGRLNDRAQEAFWHDVLAWFARNPVRAANVAPLVDYIAHRRGGGFSLKGRTAASLTRDMRHWHEVLAREELIHGRCFAPSGLKTLDIQRARRDDAGREIREVWHFREVLDSKTLADEGRAMNHCVYSYAGRVENGECAIWTLTLEDETGHWRRLTIEVRLALRRVVQARGRFNRQPEARDMVALREWAGRNNLEVGSAT